MHTEPGSQNLDDDGDDGIRLEEEDFGDTELDRDDTHGMADDAAESGESS